MGRKGAPTLARHTRRNAHTQEDENGLFAFEFDVVRIMLFVLFRSHKLVNFELRVLVAKELKGVEKEENSPYHFLNWGKDLPLLRGNQNPVIGEQKSGTAKKVISF